MANAAALLPAQVSQTTYDTGRAIALWSSAFEILAPARGEAYKNTYQLLKKAKWLLKGNIEASFHAYGVKELQPLPIWLYGEIYRGRNDFLHGNPVTAERLTIEPSQRSYLYYAPLLYRMALTAYLNLVWKGKIPSRDDTDAFGAAVSDSMGFESHQLIIEAAILTAMEPAKDDRVLTRNSSAEDVPFNSSNFNLTLTKFAKPSPSAATAGRFRPVRRAVACVGWEWRTAYPMLRSAELTFRDIVAVARMRAFGDRALTRTVILSGVALSCLALAAAGVLMLGRAHDPGSIRSYTASHKALKIALVEPAAQAQMEPVAIATAAPSGPDVRVKTAAVHDNIRAPAEQAAALKSVPLPRVKPRAMMAAVPLPRERMVEKAPECRRR